MLAEVLISFRLIVDDVAKFISVDLGRVSCDVNCHIDLEAVVGFTVKG